MAHHKKKRIRGRAPKRKRHRKSRRERKRRRLVLLNKYEPISPDTDIKKFRIAVVESLSEDEIHTGTKLY